MSRPYRSTRAGPKPSTAPNAARAGVGIAATSASDRFVRMA
jgi:hypothetical protein